MEAQALYSTKKATKKAEVDYICDLCQRKTPRESIIQNREQVSLCPACYKHINPMPEGLIKRSVMRFLAKNVV
jgi:NAD-dependent SIR2 family protein deacetylase